jgi:hypothetical protein
MPLRAQHSKLLAIRSYAGAFDTARYARDRATDSSPGARACPNGLITTYVMERIAEDLNFRFGKARDVRGGHLMLRSVSPLDAMRRDALRSLLPGLIYS